LALTVSGAQPAFARSLLTSWTTRAVAEFEVPAAGEPAAGAGVAEGLDVAVGDGLVAVFAPRHVAPLWEWCFQWWWER
jgi:hypothetical protein